MPRDLSERAMWWSTLALWSGLCLETVSASPGCSPGAPTKAGAQSTSPRIKAMQERRQAIMASKTSKRPSRPAPPKSDPR
jgi:hypothetical protein